MADILLATSRASAREHFEGALSSDGHQFTHCPDGKSVTAALEQGLPELVIADVDLPGMDAFARVATLQQTAGDCSKPNPRTIPRDELAPAALKTMEENRITSLFICDDEGRLEGILHLHDLWGLELF